MRLIEHLKETLIPGLINIVSFGHLGQPFEGHIVSDEEAEVKNDNAVTYIPSEDDIKLISDIMIQATKVLETISKTIRSDIEKGKYDDIIRNAIIDIFKQEAEQE